jgi:hypothetical protein
MAWIPLPPLSLYLNFFWSELNKSMLLFDLAIIFRSFGV